MSKKVLFCSENSKALSGFGTYYREVLSRIYDNPNFEVAEFATGATIFENLPHVKWKFYPNNVPGNDPRHQQFTQHPQNGFGAWRFDKVLLDFKPDIVCTPPGSLVLTSCGYKPIETIKKGDYVYSHTGNKRRVTETFKNEYKGKLICIRTNGYYKTTKITPEHPVLIYKYRKQANKKKSIQKIYEGVEPEFVEAQDVREKDLVVFPCFNDYIESETIPTLDLTDYLKNFKTEGEKLHPIRHNTKNTNGINKVISIDKSLATLIGYILSDGYISKSYINIFLTGDEEHYAKETVELFSKVFGLHAKIHPAKDKFMLTVRCCSVLLAEFMSQFCKDLSINELLWRYKSKDVIEGLIRGLFRGDGCYRKNTVSLTSVNEKLANNVRALCAFLGICTSINKVKRENEKHQDYYNLDGYGKNAEALHEIVEKHKDLLGMPTITSSSKRSYVTQIVNGHMVASIKTIEKEDYHGQVYNLGIEHDESYIINQISVHNCSLKDPWMFQHECESHLRAFYHQILMPTIDSVPQQEQWIEMFKNADSIFTYSDWAIPELAKACPEIDVIHSAYSGVDLKIFKPRDKKAIRAQYGLPVDAHIVGMVSRNQIRKLYPNLFRMFRMYLDKYGDTEVGKKTYLLCHTSYPDNGWEIPDLLRDYGIANRVLFSYICRNTNKPFFSYFEGARTFSSHSGVISGTLPSAGAGFDYSEMSDLYNMLDLYIQYANCFAKGQLAKTKRGWITIEDIKVGDYCWTHKGRWKKVINTFVNLPYSQDSPMMEISSYADYCTLKVTNNHSLPAYTKNEIPHGKSHSVRSKMGNMISAGKEIPSPGKYEVNELSPGDMLIYPIDDTVIDKTIIDLEPFSIKLDIVTNDTIQVKHSHKYPRYIDVDLDFCRFMGLYAADGNCSGNTIKITSHEKETDNHKLASSILSKIANKPSSIRQYKGRAANDIYISSRLHAEYFSKTFKKKDYKQLPDWIETLPLDKQKEILVGLFMGDGHYIKDKNISTLSTISQPLAEQIKTLFRRLRINFNCRIRDRSNNNYDNYIRKPQYTFEIRGNIQEHKFDTTRQSSRGVYVNNYHLVQIKTIKEIQYLDSTYNLTVQGDNSLTLKTCCGFQCEGL